MAIIGAPGGCFKFATCCWASSGAFQIP